MAVSQPNVCAVLSIPPHIVIGTTLLWEVSSSRCFAKATVGPVVSGVALRGNWLCTGDADNKAKLWRLGTGDPTRTWLGFRSSEKGEVVAVALPCVSEVSHSSTVYCVAVSTTGAAASIGCNQTALKLSTADGTQHECTTPAPVEYAMAVQGERNLVFAGLRSGHVTNDTRP